ncbi:hypothetical protein Thiowin_00174 [Thiorhodovibrio winogradskyi]|uniref:Uncharacterized protein n=1 Tax=Thiorhodovibrio winogradskyi TaxID=77007 RepID=A0ABZ0S1P2_9GAMM|nr:hypothetical protein [Thiorhodovibrio winogradskyi]
MTPLSLTIDATQLPPLTEGDPEERACYGQLAIRHGERLLSEGIDGFSHRLQAGPRVSGYPLAEWLAWNWWRLTEESKPTQITPDWRFAHQLDSVGAGYIWPNLSIFSDRARTALIAKPSHPQGQASYRSTADETLILPTPQVSQAIAHFIEQMRERLRASGIREDTNLDALWQRLQQERQDPRQSLRRRLEALLGYDPDDAPEALIAALLNETQRLGEDALLELAAAHRPQRALPGHERLRQWAKDNGYASKATDRVSPLAPDTFNTAARTPAWHQGDQAARAFRTRERITAETVSNAQLAHWCAVTPRLLTDPHSAPDLAFGLQPADQPEGHLVLRSRWPTGRRFELARLLGDWLSIGAREPLLLATASHTYRQKFQRAFAAELLCPFAALEAMLAGDHSEEAREEAAHQFQVSEQAVTTLLVNHGRLPADELDAEADNSTTNEWSQAA